MRNRREGAVVSKKYRPDPRSVPRYFFEDRYRIAIHFQVGGTERDRNGDFLKYLTNPYHKSVCQKKGASGVLS